MSAACPRFGFEVRIAPRAGISAESFAALCADFVATTVIANGLTHTGGVRTSAVYTLSRQGTQATDADRQPARRWAEAHAAAVTVEIGPLVDLDE